MGLSLETTEPWVVYVDHLRRRWRPILIGIAVSWFAVLIWQFAWPRDFQGEATLSLPPVSQLPASEPPLRAEGISLAHYKMFQPALKNHEVLSAGMGGVLGPAQIRALRRDLDRHVVPVTSSPIADIRRMGKDDQIVALELRCESRGPEQSQRVVEALATVCRRVLLSCLLLDHIDSQAAGLLSDATKEADDWSKRLLTEESLRELLSDARRIDAEHPHLATAGPQPIVDAQSHYYLAPAFQLVGVKARLAENAHELRILDSRNGERSLWLDFLPELGRRVEASIRDGAVSRVDLSALLGEELARFRSAQKWQDAERHAFSREAEALTSVVRTYGEGTRLIEVAVRRSPRAPTTMLLMAATVLLVLAAVFLWDLRQRLTSRSSGEAA